MHQVDGGQLASVLGVVARADGNRLSNLDGLVRWLGNLVRWLGDLVRWLCDLVGLVSWLGSGGDVASGHADWLHDGLSLHGLVLLGVRGNGSHSNGSSRSKSTRLSRLDRLNRLDSLGLVGVLCKSNG